MELSDIVGVKHYFALDFETFYDPNQSVDMGYRRYVESLCSAEFGGGDDIYLLTCHGPKFDKDSTDTREWGGHPKDFPWEWLRERPDTGLVAHNMAFDWPVLWRCVQLGYAPEWVLSLPAFCSMDMASGLQYARGLKPAVKAVFDKDLSKAIRGNMRGKTWDDAVREGISDDLMQYGLDDAKWCWRLWMKLYRFWPAEERLLSIITREMSWAGVPVNLSLLEEGCEALDKLKWDTSERIPWKGKWDDKYNREFPLSSKRALAQECRKLGIDFPSSTAKDSDVYLNWLEKYGAEHDFVAAMAQYADVNGYLSRIQSMRGRVYESSDGPRLSYGLKYWGAHTTGRFSGDQGCNVQNMPRKEKYGVNQRHCIEAPEGKTFVIADKSQIEPRCLARVVEDYDFLNLIKDGYNPYEAHARLSMGWTGGSLKEEDPDLYTLAKIRVLQLGYGCGWYRFYETVKYFDQLQILEGDYTKSQLQKFGSFLSSSNWKGGNIRLKEWPDLDEDTQRHWVNAYIQVFDFRSSASGKKIKALWNIYEREYKSTLSGDMEVTLLNGDKIHYFKIRPEANGQVEALTRRGDLHRTAFYGSKIVENRIQREARNCFAQDLLNLHAEGYKVVMHIHDEVVVECDEYDAERVASEVRRILSITPAWMGDCPLDASAIISKRYVK
tara:strand:- start:5575 stop:7572 length:1998 start_codon:yes stop_codon:yes gene_type:complete